MSLAAELYGQEQVSPTPIKLVHSIQPAMANGKLVYTRIAYGSGKLLPEHEAKMPEATEALDQLLRKGLIGSPNKEGTLLRLRRIGTMQLLEKFGVLHTTTGQKQAQATIEQAFATRKDVDVKTQTYGADQVPGLEPGTDDDRHNALFAKAYRQAEIAGPDPENRSRLMGLMDSYEFHPVAYALEFTRQKHQTDAIMMHRAAVLLLGQEIGT